ncbi:MAG: pyrroloquinoline quinone biosynthesis peptide chaperone PqqD [Hyphomicrobiaceae bacterium]|nr:pyrroloquinoline quinone biosynthesis peptide chaperone PqqD [Hyphomicrobiaceae bacterium]
MTDPGSGGPATTSRRQRTVVSAASTPHLSRSFKLQHDKTRDRWIIQGPERVFSPDAIAVEVLRLCDGRRTVAEVAESLSLRYTAPKEQIVADIVSMLQDLADKGVVSCTDARLH